MLPALAYAGKARITKSSSTVEIITCLVLTFERNTEHHPHVLAQTPEKY